MIRIIPVIDLKAGVVVRGVAGRRERYQPLVSPLTLSAEPAAFYEAFLNRLGFRDVYVADLDAIQGGPVSWSVFSLGLERGACLWVDAGPRDSGAVRRLAEFQSGGRAIDGVILGLESLDTPDRLPELLAAAGGPDRAVFSLDLCDAQPLTASDAWRGWDSERIADYAVETGFRRVIVLDLRRVGVDTGTGTEDLLRRLSTRHPSCEWIAGGGVRGRDDLARLEACGCAGALVATALHDGRLP